LTLGLGSLIILTFSSCQKEKNPFLINYHENARLKQIWLYSSIDPEYMIGLQQEYEYNENGQISKVSTPMYKDGKIAGLISYELYEYNSSWQLSEMNKFYNSSTDSSGFRNSGRYIYFYSGDGMLEKKTEGTVVGYIRKSYLYEYQDGQLIKIKQYNHDNELEICTENQYDSVGNLVKESTYGSDGIGKTYIIHTYSENLLVKSDVFTFKGDVHVREIKRTYDINNNLIILESTELTSFSDFMPHSVLRFVYN
jgi:hypothetical protein